MTDDNQNPELNGEVLTELQNQASALQSQNTTDHALVNQLLGQAQMADSMAQFSLTVSTSKMAFVKENKLYKALAGQTTADGQQLSGTWDDFCRLLGKSRQKVDEDILNLRQLGEEALESMSRMGIGYREMRQYRKLPEDDKTALLEAAKSGDKEAFVELAEEIISKNAKDKEELKKQLDEKTADYDAQDELLHKTSMDLTNTRMELEKTKKRVQTMQPDDAIKELRQEVSNVAYEAEVTVMGNMRKAFETLSEQSAETGTDERKLMAELVTKLEKELIALREDFDLPDIEGGDFNWMDPDALADVEAQLGVSEEQQYDFVEDQYQPHDNDKEQSDESTSESGDH